MKNQSRRIAMMAGLIALCCMLGIAQETTDAIIQPGDVLFVKVQRHPDLTSSAQVNEQGAISLPYVGEVLVGGLAESAASARISNAYLSILRNPRVTVSRSAGRIMSTESRTREMTTQVVPLNNSTAEVLYNALEGMTSAGGSINFDPDTNTLILTDTPATIQNMMGVITQLDKMKSQTTQVHIETRIAEVESSAVKEVGVKWFAQGDHAGGGWNRGARQTTRVNSLHSENDPTYNEHIDSSRNTGNTYGGRRFLDEGDFDRRMQVPVQIAAPGQMFFGYMNSGIDLGVFLDALAADGKAETLATPYIRTVNHKTARIKMTDEYPYTELGSVGLSSATTTEFLDIGIVLDVTPHVREDTGGQAYVRLELEPEVSTASGMSNGIPVRSVRSSSSVADARDGQTVVIGGIMKADSQDYIQKVPGLGDLPLMGNLFRHKERTKGQRELMIFVTPHVMERPEDMSWDHQVGLSELAGAATFTSVPGAPPEGRKE